MRGWRAILWFPMSLRIGVGRGCRPDIRIQMFQFMAGAPVDAALNGSHCTELDGHGFWKQLRKIFSCVGRVGGIAAIQILLPSFVPVLQKFFCVSGLVAFLARKRTHDEIAPTSSAMMEWHSFSLLQFLRDIIEQMSQPFMIATLFKESWSFVHPESYYLVDCSVALLEVDREQKRLARRIARGKIVGDKEIEQAWIEQHKKSAQRVAHLLKELPDTPPLKELIDFLEKVVVEIGKTYQNGPFPVQCLSEGDHWSCVLMLPPQNSETCHWEGYKDKIKGKAVFKKEERAVVPERFTYRPSTSQISPPASEIYAFPLEAELERIESDEESFEDVASTSGTDIESRLYGRQDHITEEPLTTIETIELSFRGLKLFFAFLPFLFLGLLLLLVAYSLEIQSKQLSRRKRRNYILDATPGTKWATRLRTSAYEQLLQGCRDGGPAFIKWGQWSSSREDLFPAEFCNVLSDLHDNAPVHSFKETRKEIRRAFGRSIEDIFESFDPEPLASGSVAQVHRAVYRKNGNAIPVIVKVRHPNVGQQIRQDFQILKPLASMASKIPYLKDLPLNESVSQFSSTMTAQTDFRVEAAHIRRFYQNFESVRHSVVIPQIVEDLVSESVLVETFEPGESVSRFIKTPSEMNTKIVTLGVDAYLKMLLSDNFVHTDLHPGNILVREVSQDGNKSIQIVLLDFGLAEELRPEIRKHFISFLNFISKGDGFNAAQHLLQWSKDQHCRNPSSFIEDMKRLFETDCAIKTSEGIDLDAVMKSVLRLAQKHGVSIDSAYASLVVGVCIIVGFAHSLDARVNLMDAATPVLLTYALTGRVVGRLYG